MRRLWGLSWIVAGFLVLALTLPMGDQLFVGAGKKLAADTLLLDPGHGGMDGGAVGANGVSEKDINLAISKMIAKLAEKDGWNVILTRDKDQGLYTDVVNDGTEQMEIKNKRSIRSLKTEDLKNRKKLVDDLKPTLSVSIHLNSFREDRSVHGAQSFYPAGSGDKEIEEESKRLAECIQKHIVAGLQDGTDRAVLGKKDMILFKNPTTPIALVECGFLSNREEEQRLQDKKYQQKLASFIYQGIMDYCGKEPAAEKKSETPLVLVDTEKKNEQVSQ